MANCNIEDIAIKMIQPLSICLLSFYKLKSLLLRYNSWFFLRNINYNTSLTQTKMVGNLLSENFGSMILNWRLEMFVFNNDIHLQNYVPIF